MMNKKESKETMKKITLREHYSMFRSQAAAAEDIGVSTNMYSLWFCGNYKPCWKSMQKLEAKNISMKNFPD